MAADLVIRPARGPEDDAFIEAVYASTRREEFTAAGLPAAEIDFLLRMQFDAQSRQYAVSYPEAQSLVVVVGDAPVGRLIVDSTAVDVRIVDVALLPEFRRAGIGRRVVDHVVGSAGARPVRCSVVDGNDARRFWERLGFTALRRDGAHTEMELACATSAT